MRISGPPQLQRELSWLDHQITHCQQELAALVDPLEREAAEEALKRLQQRSVELESNGNQLHRAIEALRGCRHPLAET